MSEKEKAPTKDKKNKDKNRKIKNEIDFEPTLEGLTAFVALLDSVKPTTIYEDHILDIAEDVDIMGGDLFTFFKEEKDLSVDDAAIFTSILLPEEIGVTNYTNIFDLVSELSEHYDNIVFVGDPLSASLYRNIVEEFNEEEYGFSNILEYHTSTTYHEDGELHPALEELREDYEEIIESQRLLGEEVQIDERALSTAERRKRGRTMKKYRSKIAMARKRAKKRKAPIGKLKDRAKKKARNMLKDRLTGNKKYSDLSPSAKAAIDKKVQKKSGYVNRMARKLLPKVKKAEMKRLSEGQETCAPIKYRYHKLFNKVNQVHCDRRFKIYRDKNKKNSSELNELHRVFVFGRSEFKRLAKMVEEKILPSIERLGIEFDKPTFKLIGTEGSGIYEASFNVSGDIDSSIVIVHEIGRTQDEFSQLSEIEYRYNINGRRHDKLVVSVTVNYDGNNISYDASELQYFIKRIKSKLELSL